jgi:hypothetical protein
LHHPQRVAVEEWYPERRRVFGPTAFEEAYFDELARNRQRTRGIHTPDARESRGRLLCLFAAEKFKPRFQIGMLGINRLFKTHAGNLGQTAAKRSAPYECVTFRLIFAELVMFQLPVTRCLEKMDQFARRSFSGTIPRSVDGDGPGPGGCRRAGPF